MKTLIPIFILFLSLSASAKERCFELENYGELCLNYHGAAPINSEVQVTIYEGSELKETLSTKGSEYHSGGSFCGGKEHDCWTIPGGFQIHAESAKYSVFLNLSRWMTINSCVRCSSSSVSVKGDRSQYIRIR